MKTAEQLRHKLKRQWFNGDLRQQRLLEHGQWPLLLSIGKPSPTLMINDTAKVREHIQHWRNVTDAEVEWQPVNYRSTAEPVQLPINWILHSTKEWIDAIADQAVRQEYLVISTVISAVDPTFHPVIVRQRQQLLSRGIDESIKACEVANQLEPGCAEGRPLRALSIAGCDSKFFERNRTLLIKLLEVRFGQQIVEMGLEDFLGALDESEHWLLVVPLDAGLLPFKQQRIRSSELAQTSLPGSHLLVIENERSLYQLPQLNGTIAILGAGLNLSWLQANWISEKSIAYWGDIDTWGLTMLAMARSYQPSLKPLLMDKETFNQYCEKSAVTEPVAAGPSVPLMLTKQEGEFYFDLLQFEKGRLEQEFVSEQLVKTTIKQWYILTK